MVDIKSLEYPFGIDVDTLVVCISGEHRRRVIEAFELKARYILWWQTGLMGARYKKVIVFKMPLGHYEAERILDFMDMLQTKLPLNKSIIVV